MKKRLMSAIVALAILFPLVYLGGLWYRIAIYVLALFGLKEFIDMKETKKELPFFVKLLSYLILTMMIVPNFNQKGLILSLDYRIVAGLFLAYLIPTIFYHDRRKYSVNDAFFLIGGIFFLGTAFNLMVLLRAESLFLVLYLLLITITTDTYAYIVGSLVGRHRLLEPISPKKTWEGFIGGILFGTFVGTVFYHVAVDMTLPLYVVILMTAFLSLLGQFGDLAFSAIKRYFGKKDFSHIMPGHGGVLDRFDSIIFVVLGFVFFIRMI